MEYLTQLFLPVSIWVQNAPDWIMSIMKGFTFLGNTEFYLLIMPLLYWCLDITLGIRIGILLLVSGGFNSLLKFGFHSPRPFWVSSRIEHLADGTGFGFPSGHSQNAAGLWGLFAFSTQKTWLKIASVILIFLIGVSRIFLGVHFLHDVLMGWLVGAGLMLLFIKAEDRVSSWFKRSPVGLQIVALVLATSIFILPALLMVDPINPPSIPQAWIEGAGEAITPYSYHDLLTIAGAFMGLGLGLILLNKTGMFTQQGTFWQLTLRYLIGVTGVLILYLGLGSIFPSGITLLSYGLRFLRYFIIGVWISYGAPKCFSGLKLTTILPK